MADGVLVLDIAGNELVTELAAFQVPHDLVVFVRADEFLQVGLDEAQERLDGLLDFQLELIANRQDTELGFDEGLFGGTIDVADMTIAYYHVGMLFQTTDNDVVPFFVASAGVIRLDPDVPGADSEERFSMSLGGGVKVLFNEHFGLRFEGRGYFTLIDDYDSGCYDDDYCCDCGYYDSGTSLSQGEASVGMIFAW